MKGREKKIQLGRKNLLQISKLRVGCVGRGGAVWLDMEEELAGAWVASGSGSSLPGKCSQGSGEVIKVYMKTAPGDLEASAFRGEWPG